MERVIKGIIYTEADIPTHFDSYEEEADWWYTHDFSEEFIRTHQIRPEDSPLRKFREERRKQNNP